MKGNRTESEMQSRIIGNRLLFPSHLSLHFLLTKKKYENKNCEVIEEFSQNVSIESHMNFLNAIFENDYLHMKMILVCWHGFALIDFN